MELTTTYLGQTLRTPLVASASPMMESLDNIKRLEDAGISAVVLHSLFEEQLVREQHELEYHLTHGTESFAEALTYFPEPDDFDTGPDAYLEHIRAVKEAVDIPVIASLNGSTLGGWTEFAKQMQSAGADALELNLYAIQSDMDKSGAEVEAGYLEVVKAVRNEVTIPLALKLSPFFSNMAYMAKQFKGVGADALVLFNRFYQPDIDINELEVSRKILLSTPPELRLPLTWIGMLYGRLQLDFAATTGVHSAVDALKLLMVGANVTMMASALYKNGINHVATVEREMRHWMIEHEYDSVKQMQGSMSQFKSANPGAYERAQYVRAVSTLPGDYPIH